MDYELAKELKDAGFPMYDDPISRHEVDMLPYINEDGSRWYAPTLEELIEACEKITYGLFLQHTGNNYIAGIWGKGNSLSQIGKTPSEAVARLFLSINKK